MAQGPSNTPFSSEIAIILVNWNGWRDTIECLESVFHNDCDNFQAIVCDNASTDESWDKIISWAAGNELAIPASDEMVSYSQPSVAKPVAIKLIDQEGNISGDPDAKLILIQTGANLGFAGGNNVGMQYALDHSDCEYFWLLNNDTVIARDAIGHLIQHMKASPEVGMCGTRIHFYHQPDVIQALGGASYNSWTGTSKCIGSLKPKDYTLPLSEALERMDFVAGASLTVTRKYLEQIGFMNEKYFLFFEEIDWASRNDNKFLMGYAPASLVFHKEGGSTGSNSTGGKRSDKAEYYLTSSKLKFTRNFLPYKLPSIYAYIIAQIMVRLFRGDFKKSSIMLKLLFGLAKKG